MKLRDSGMPDETWWESLFDVALILDRLGIHARIGDVVELGCGYGTFTIPVARRIRGRVFAFDLEADMVAQTQQRAREAGLTNVLCQQRDVVEDGYGIPPQSVEGCLLFNILHGEDPIKLLAQAAALLRPGGRVWAIHWRYDPTTPRGPSMDIRPRPEQIAHWAEATRLLKRVGNLLDLPPWHYGWQFQRLSGEGNRSGPRHPVSCPLSRVRRSGRRLQLRVRPRHSVDLQNWRRDGPILTKNELLDSVCVEEVVQG